MDARDKKIVTDLSYEIIKEVGRAIRPYVGKVEFGEKVKMGADGTPTSLIDIIAEEKVTKQSKQERTTVLQARHLIHLYT